MNNMSFRYIFHVAFPVTFFTIILALQLFFFYKPPQLLWLQLNYQPQSSSACSSPWALVTSVNWFKGAVPIY